MSSWVVYAGIVTRSSAKMAQHTGYAVEKVIYNKNYNHRSHDSDIALMKLRTPLNFSGQSESLLAREQHFKNTKKNSILQPQFAVLSPPDDTLRQTSLHQTTTKVILSSFFL